MIEREIWGEIPVAEFERLTALLTARYGEPRRERRLALQCTDYSRHDLDTRIRITNGNAALIQKLGNWNAAERHEVETDLPADPVLIAGLYRGFCRILEGPSVRRNIIQLENSLFDGDGLEIKLTSQIGTQTVYSYEIEQVDEKTDLLAACRGLGLEPDLTHKDEAFWSAFNDRVNLGSETLSDELLLDLIAAYV